MIMNRHYDAKLELKSIEDTGEFSGYGSVFGNQDSYGDIVIKGAFEDSLEDYSERGSLPALLWQHKHDEPIGIYTKMVEDDHGLYVEGELFLNDDVVAKRAHAHMKRGSVTGLSIGYRLKGEDSYEYDMDKDAFLLKKIDLYEVSVVTIPANDVARVETVKSMIMKGCKPHRKDVERALRDMFGCSVSQAKRFMAEGMSSFTVDDVEDEILSELGSILKSHNTAKRG